MAQTARHIATKNGKVAAKQSRKKRNVFKSVSISKAKRQAKQIINALHEAEQIHKGKRTGKSLNEFLEEL